MSQSSGGFLSSLFPIIMVALGAAGVFVKQAPLKSDRAMDPPHAVRVEALGLQDPFVAVEKHDERSETDVIKEIRERIQKILKTDRQVRIIGVSLFDGSYSEAVESRRRTRLAVLSALSFHGYFPDSDAIGYFRVKLPDGGSHNAWPHSGTGGVDFTLIGPAGSATLLELVRGRSDPAPVDMTVPYEWFTGSQSSGLLVLWLNENKLSPAPLRKLRSLITKLTSAKESSHPTPTINGPKGDFSTMVNDTPRVFVTNASIPNCDLDPSGPLKPWNCFMIETPDPLREIAAIRSIPTDDVLAAAVLWELWQRGVNRVAAKADYSGLDDRRLTPPPSSGSSVVDTFRRPCVDGLVLIVEHQSLQSRALSRYLAEGFSEGCRHGGFSVSTYGYYRYLDSDRRKEDSVKSETLNWQLDSGSIDPAEGSSQYDYLRRLGDEIAVLDSDFRFAIRGVKAIGIIGSDVYDKLLILQALRSRFKDKIFFTTDFDARYLYASQKKWTRNLVVATSFDLSLNSVMQHSTIGFRDSYQTATYLAVLMALEARSFEYWTAKTKDWLRPRILEIGRTEAVHLASPSIDDLGKWIKSGYSDGSAPPPAQAKCDDSWAACANIAREQPSHGLPSGDLIALFLLILVGCLFALLSPRVQETSRAAYDALTSSVSAEARIAKVWLIIASALLFAALTIVVLAHRAMDASYAQGAGEPFRWLEGISVWPSIILRFAGFVTMIALVIVFIIRIQRQANLISNNFDLPTPQTWKLSRPRWSTVLIGPHFDLASFGTDGKINPKSAGEGVEITSLWQNYLRGTCWRQMSWWILTSTVFMFLLAVGFIYFVGGPSFPARGLLVETLYRRLNFLNIVFLWLLIFWVGYETRACSRFVAILSDVRSVWPKSLLDREEAKTGIPRAHLDDYLDFQLIVSATRRIHSLIYLPFVLLFFLVLSHSPLLDRIGFALVDVFIIGTAFAYALYNAVFLRRSAEAARAKTLENYNSQLIIQLGPKNSRSPNATHQGATNSPLVSPEQIKLLMERIRDTRDGAFAPFSQQPAVQALLLPFGGYGGVQLIEYFINF